MTRGKVKIIAHRRRRSGRTDYRLRLRLLRSGRPRFVVRRSLNSMACQVVQHDSRGDKTLVTASTKHLDRFGWRGPKGNLPSAYLTGLLCGTLAKKVGVGSAVLDMGLHASTKGSRIYSALKGALDAGLDIPHSPDILPPIERVRGQHIEKYAESQGKKLAMARMFDEAKAAIKKGRPVAKPGKAKPAKAPRKARKPRKEPAKKTRKTPAKKPRARKK